MVRTLGIEPSSSALQADVRTTFTESALLVPSAGIEPTSDAYEASASPGMLTRLVPLRGIEPMFAPYQRAGLPLTYSDGYNAKGPELSLRTPEVSITTT